jgi:hypothetical protein
LELLRKEAARLAAQPNPDAPDFVPCPADRAREAQYAQREAIELANRAALRSGTRRLDDAPAPPPAQTTIKGSAW